MKTSTDNAGRAWTVAINVECIKRVTCQFRARFRRTRREVFPILGRIQNIGYEKGENGRTPEWYRSNHRTSWVADGVKNAEFGLTAG